MINLFLPFVLFFTFSNSDASIESIEPPPHLIDQTLDQCLSVPENMTTVGMIECTAEAYQAWDDELNLVYNGLLSVLSENQQEKLKITQKAWLQFRDAEFETIYSIYENLEGTMYLPMHEHAKLEIIKERTLTLQGYLDLMTLHD